MGEPLLISVREKILLLYLIEISVSHPVRLHFQESSAREGGCHDTSVAAPEFWDGVLLGDWPCCGVFCKVQVISVFEIKAMVEVFNTRCFLDVFESNA
jgi:hypothetical protein